MDRRVPRRTANRRQPPTVTPPLIVPNQQLLIDVFGQFKSYGYEDICRTLCKFIGIPIDTPPSNKLHNAYMAGLIPPDAAAAPLPVVRDIPPPPTNADMLRLNEAPRQHANLGRYLRPRQFRQAKKVTSAASLPNMPATSSGLIEEESFTSSGDSLRSITTPTPSANPAQPVRVSFNDVYMRAPGNVGSGSDLPPILVTPSMSEEPVYKRVLRADPPDDGGYYEINTPPAPLAPMATFDSSTDEEVDEPTTSTVADTEKGLSTAGCLKGLAKQFKKSLGLGGKKKKKSNWGRRKKTTSTTATTSTTTAMTASTSGSSSIEGLDDMSVGMARGAESGFNFSDSPLNPIAVGATINFDSGRNDTQNTSQLLDHSALDHDRSAFDVSIEQPGTSQAADRSLQMRKRRAADNDNIVAAVPKVQKTTGVLIDQAMFRCPCQNCEMAYKTLRGLRCHMSRSHNTTIRVCDNERCYKPCVNNLELEQHKLNHH